MKYIVVQNKYHQKSIQQLSEELNIAPQTVKNQLTKALRRIEFLLRRDHAKEISFLAVVVATMHTNSILGKTRTAFSLSFHFLFLAFSDYVFIGLESDLLFTAMESLLYWPLLYQR